MVAHPKSRSQEAVGVVAAMVAVVSRVAVAAAAVVVQVVAKVEEGSL